MNFASLNRKFRIPGKLEITSEHGGFPIAIITNDFAMALISIYGGHVMSYQPNGQKEILWMSSLSIFSEGRPIRGGIPVCFPWFGPHPTDPQKPQHGFARTQMWQLVGAIQLPGGETQIRLLLHDSPKSNAIWPHPFSAELLITIGSSLDVVLKCTNTGKEQFSYSDALHSYFAISDIANIKIIGLGGSRYYDGVNATVPTVQKEEALIIQKEENRRYIDTESVCIIEDKGLSRKIRVCKTGSRVTVVWNPGEKTTKNITDMADDGYKTMICVEAANAFNNTITLQPEESHILATNIAVES